MLILVRHGRTEANAAGELLGRRDPHLDEVGRLQAAEIAAVLPSVQRIITSPLMRCIETARIIQSNAAPDSILEVDDQFVEIDYGSLEGTPVGQVPAKTWERWRSEPAWSPGGGESLATVSTRVGLALDEVRQSDSGEGPIVIVTHVSPIKAAIGWALGLGPEIAWRCHVAQASIHRVDASGDMPRLIEFNRTSHLSI